MKSFLNEATQQDHPLRVLTEFLKKEQQLETAKLYNELRFVGYVLDIGYDELTIITSDPFKLNVGGIPRNSFLIMVPSKYEQFEPHFTLLRVLESVATPLSREVQQTYFELQKKSMPEIDRFTQGELQWGALKAEIIGMFYPNPQTRRKVEFSGDLNNFVSAHKYKIYAPLDDLLELIINALVTSNNSFELGNLRMSENRLVLPNKKLPNVGVQISPSDFLAARSAMFGKTRLGKSNIVKLIAESLIQKGNGKVGQLIFDINGEYANDNPQDNNFSLRSTYPSNCVVYALTPKPNTISKPLKLNFYAHPDQSHRIIGELLHESRRSSSNYVSNFIGASIPELGNLNELSPNEKTRVTRKILLYWTILNVAGFNINDKELKKINIPLNPKYNKQFRDDLYKGNPPTLSSFDDVVQEFVKIAEFMRNNRNDPVSTSGNPLFDADDKALLKFLKPTAGAGPSLIQPFRKYHDLSAGNFTSEIIDLLDQGKTVIIDLGNANPEVMNYFSEDLTRNIFMHQVDKFVSNNLKDHYVQLYFEEAHNLFPSADNPKGDFYQRVAKEGAKYHIGMVYSTQSVTSVSSDLLNQTENFFIAHLSSVNEVNALARVNAAFNSVKDDILKSRQPGYVRIMTRSHRFVIPVQAKKFEPKGDESNAI